MAGAPYSILFVCSGNIFRSMTAEYALKKLLTTDSEIAVSSAGTEALSQEMNSMVKEYLTEHEIDPSPHRQRKISAEILSKADLVVCFGLNHRAHLSEKFNCNARLFRELTRGTEEGIPDIWETVANWQQNPTKSRVYARQVLDEICGSMPELLVAVRALRDGG